jgi:hypothetical protein
VLASSTSLSIPVSLYAKSSDQYFSTFYELLTNSKVPEMFVYKYISQSCLTFLYIGAHLTDGCGGAGAVWRLE